MKTTHTSLPFAGHTLHFVEFDPANFCEQDLLWLPHYAQLQHAGRKRKAEHLAGRWLQFIRCGNMAINVCPQSASYANRCGLRRYTAVSATGGLRHGHGFRQPIGVDIEEIFSAQTATELTDNIITPAEHEQLADCGLAFSLALTLAFSAKESAFKASDPN
ncbi:enterobactin synthase subunit EntD [Escherichia coli]